MAVERQQSTAICPACGQQLAPKVGPLLCDPCEATGVRRPADVFAKDGKTPLCSRHGAAVWVTGRQP